jgi:hypothetical protein
VDDGDVAPLVERNEGIDVLIPVAAVARDDVQAASRAPSAVLIRNDNTLLPDVVVTGEHPDADDALHIVATTVQHAAPGVKGSL